MMEPEAHDAQEVPKRSAAIASAQLEPGQATWLAHQRWLWRRGRLGQERSRLLRLVGVESVVDTADQWRDLAHEAAYFMHGCEIGQVRWLVRAWHARMSTGRGNHAAGCLQSSAE